MTSTTQLDEAIERGIARARQEDWNAACEAFRRAVSLDSQSVEARFRLGWALWNRSEEIKPTVADLAVGYGAQMLGIAGVAKDRGKKCRDRRESVRESAHW